MEKVPSQYPRSSLEGHASPESIETLAVLRDFLAKGYLFHGSKSNADLLEPRQARDVDAGRVLGNQFGVYAADGIEIPVFMALKQIADPFIGRSSSGYHGNNDIYTMHGKNTILTPGFVHVLPRDAFTQEQDEHGDYEFIARNPVRAVAVITVKPDIMRLLPNITSLDLSLESGAPDLN